MSKFGLLNIIHAVCLGRVALAAPITTTSPTLGWIVICLSAVGNGITFAMARRS